MHHHLHLNWQSPNNNPMDFMVWFPGNLSSLFDNVVTLKWSPWGCELAGGMPPHPWGPRVETTNLGFSLRTIANWPFFRRYGGKSIEGASSSPMKPWAVVGKLWDACLMVPQWIIFSLSKSCGQSTCNWRERERERSQIKEDIYARVSGLGQCVESAGGW